MCDGCIGRGDDGVVGMRGESWDGRASVEYCKTFLDLNTMHAFPNIQDECLV
jgi:hypothetical protein